MLFRSGLGDARRTGNWNWAQVNGFYQAPANYKRLVQRLQASLRNQLQELVLGEGGSGRNDEEKQREEEEERPGRRPQVGDSPPMKSGRARQP